MTLRTDKDLKSKNVRWKKVYILAKDIDSKRKFEIKAKKNRLEKAIFMHFCVSVLCKSVTKHVRILDLTCTKPQHLSILPNISSCFLENL